MRRHVELLGYLPKPGVAGSIAVALEADGRRPVEIPENTGFRSEAFGAQPPQVYELTSGKTIDSLCNRWSIGAIRKNALPDHPPSLAEHPEYSPSPSDSETAFFVFETENFSLAEDRLVVFEGEGVNFPRVVSRVTEIMPFEGRDGKSYVRVRVHPPVETKRTIASSAGWPTPRCHSVFYESLLRPPTSELPELVPNQRRIKSCYRALLSENHSTRWY